ncbi:MAG: hypothetical protein Q9160_008474 [Pyrenula sp. 1 TL-2023]
MEGKMLEALHCAKGAKVLDAGCGTGHVALYMAKEGGFHVEGIDLTPHHIVKATRNIQLAGMTNQVRAKVGDYHNLEDFENADFDGIYTMETLVHSINPREVLKEFLRILKPGGSLVMHEYDHPRIELAPKGIADEAKTLNSVVCMPAFESFEMDDLKNLAQEVGFENVVSKDMSKNIVPMLWLFFVFAYIPWLIFKLLGLQYKFVNTTSGVGMYVGRKYWRYVQVSARKPL